MRMGTHASSAAVCSFPISEVMKTQRFHRENEGQRALLPGMWIHLSHDLETVVPGCVI